mmetsp:Transcript_68806/g.194191  ORF Transcript_68806/g.194191 Transcript_68806/m.194191 type:complete len:285 (+) Transcript_68806:101-955(+)
MSAAAGATGAAPRESAGLRPQGGAGAVRADTVQLRLEGQQARDAHAGQKGQHPPLPGHPAAVGAAVGGVAVAPRRAVARELQPPLRRAGEAEHGVAQARREEQGLVPPGLAVDVDEQHGDGVPDDLGGHEGGGEEPHRHEDPDEVLDNAGEDEYQCVSLLDHHHARYVHERGQDSADNQRQKIELPDRRCFHRADLRDGGDRREDERADRRRVGQQRGRVELVLAAQGLLDEDDAYAFRHLRHEQRDQPRQDKLHLPSHREHHAGGDGADYLEMQAFQLGEAEG